MVKIYRKHRAIICRCMRITTIIIGIQAFFTSALLASTINAQSVSLNIKNAKVAQVFADIEKQTNVTFVYNTEAITGLSNITIKVDKQTLSEVLTILTRKLPLQFRQSGTVIGVDRISYQKPQAVPSEKTEPVSTAPPLTINGRVLNENGQPLSGASIRVKGTSIATSTDQNGAFTLQNVKENSVVVISYVGYLPKEVTVTREVSNIIVTLALASSKLDEVVIIPYGTTTERLNTGSVAKVSTKEIDEEPVSNPLAALQGRVAGLIVTQASGLPGSSYTVQVRGQNSILSGTDPLYIVDGVPFNGTSLDEVSLGYPSKQSPFNSISPNDIESIEVLKDADATAIYGSRGANGVILITTKKGKAGKTRIDADVNSGFGKVTRTMQFLNTQQYLSVREEAFRNDNRAITPAVAYDLVSWDTTRDINWQQMLIGGTAHQTNAQASISGGNDQTQFLVGTNYHRETTVFPGDFNEQRADVHFNINHQSLDNRFSMTVSGSYSNDVNHMIQGDLFSNINLPPDAPYPYDANHNLAWQENGYYYLNPLAPLYQPYTATTDNLLGNINLSYKILPGLTAKVDAGYSYMQLDQVAITPADSQYPPFSPESYTTFGSNNIKGWIVEPQLNYTRTIGKGTLEALLGGSEQQQVTNGDNIFATGYSSDALLASTSGASSVSSSSNYSEYRYQAIFGRLHYMWDNKYILNLTGRRDGSSRFGPGNQYANFGAIGAAWVFSEESLIKDKLPFLSYGKLRASYGITGNDQIGDYRYLDSWRPTVYPYQGITGLQSYTLFNPNYAWEINKKLEAAMDLGFFKDRILFSASYFRNRSSDQ
ncbi:MAG: SusC/RagA family TonB-linked outer membrane protein, partial [Bacteroidetes bacterium]|nr:SusC/RagA family TonB-linked outer membrane protein [Bacteroidota bacterium]